MDETTLYHIRGYPSEGRIRWVSFLSMRKSHYMVLFTFPFLLLVQTTFCLLQDMKFCTFSAAWNKLGQCFLLFHTVSDWIRHLFLLLDHLVACVKVLGMPTCLCHSQIHPGHLDKLILFLHSLSLLFPDFSLGWACLHMYDIIYFTILSGWLSKRGAGI